MEKAIIATSSAPCAIGPYSQATAGNGIITVSGQLPIDPQSGCMANTIEEQTAQSMRNVLRILEAGGSSPSKILKCCLFVRNIKDFDQINKVYASFFEKDPPARVVVEVSNLPKNADIEIDALALC